MRPVDFKRAAALRELASLGVHQAKAVAMIGIFPAQAATLKREFGFDFPRKSRFSTPFSKAVRDGYERGIPPSQIANSTGSTAASVKVRASQMGLTARSTRDPAKHKRGFAIPVERMDEYKALRKLGLTFEECGMEMGLLARPTVALRFTHHRETSPQLSVAS